MLAPKKVEVVIFFKPFVTLYCIRDFQINFNFNF